MRHAFSIRTAAAAIALLLAVGVVAQARGPAHFDKSKERTLSGTVEAVTEVPGGRQGGGLHVTLAAAAEKWEALLGPQPYARSIGLVLARGDAISVTGATDSAAHTVVVREVRKGEKSYRLRDENGVPLWSGGPKK